MKERDPLDALLGEWKSPEPSPELDERVMRAYRAQPEAVKALGWRRFWTARISVPVPVLIAAIAVLALFLWVRSASQSRALPEASGIVTHLNATGFQPLPNGQARVLPVNERRHEIH